MIVRSSAMAGTLDRDRGSMYPKSLNDDDLLLLYLTGELPAERLAEFEQRIAHEPGLRAQLATLEDAYHAAESALRTADASERISLSASTAARRVGQQVRSRQARQTGRVAIAPRRQRPARTMRWAYLGTAAAAAIIAGFTVWYGLRPEPASPVVQRSDPASPSIWRSPGGGIMYPVPDAANPFAVDNAGEVDAWPGGATDGLADAAELDSELALAEAEDELSVLSDPRADGNDSDPGDLPMLLLIGNFDER